MDETILNLIKFKKIDISLLYISKDEIKKAFDIKETTYSKWKKLFLEKIEERVYPKEAYLDIGKDMYNIYAWLHFASNYKYFQDKRLAKKVSEFNSDTVRKFKELGVA